MPVVSQKEFCLRVEENCAFESMSIIEAVLEACQHYRVDVESAGEFINRTIKERLAVEAHRKNLHKITSLGNLDEFLG